jgi:hypothetical protein
LTRFEDIFAVFDVLQVFVIKRLVMSSRNQMNKRSQGQRRRLQNRGLSTRSRNFIPNQPPTVNTAPTTKRTFRWVNPTGSGGIDSTLITTESLLSALFVANTTSTGSAIIGSLRIIKISAWCDGDVGLQWWAPSTGNSGAKIVNRVDKTLGTTYISKTMLRPVPGTGSAAWQNWAIGGTTSTDGAAFLLGFTGNIVLDVKMEYTLTTSATVYPASFIDTPSGMTVGLLYQNKLGPSTSGPVLVPLGQQTYEGV